MPAFGLVPRPFWPEHRKSSAISSAKKCLDWQRDKECNIPMMTCCWIPSGGFLMNSARLPCCEVQPGCTVRLQAMWALPAVSGIVILGNTRQAAMQRVAEQCTHDCGNAYANWAGRCFWFLKIVMASEWA